MFLKQVCVIIVILLNVKARRLFDDTCEIEMHDCVQDIHDSVSKFREILVHKMEEGRLLQDNTEAKLKEAIEEHRTEVKEGPTLCQNAFIGNEHMLDHLAAFCNLSEHDKASKKFENTTHLLDYFVDIPKMDEAAYGNLTMKKRFCTSYVPYTKIACAPFENRVKLFKNCDLVEIYRKVYVTAWDACVLELAIQISKTLIDEDN